MKIGLTGGTGFLGRYILENLVENNHSVRAWTRRNQQQRQNVEWISGELNDSQSTSALVTGCDVVVHSALYHPHSNFRVASDSLLEFAEKNIMGTLRLMSDARKAGVSRFIFISSCAVHDKILSDRQLDETHPLWPASHYGAHKAALEKFVHSFGMGEGWDVCSLRPTGIYGVADPASDSRWYDLIRKVVKGEPVHCAKGGKEVHARDVARAVTLLLTAPQIAGEAYNCCERYISEWEVAHLAKEMANTAGAISGMETAPKNQISTAKLRDLGFAFGGPGLIRETVAELVTVAQSES